MENIITTKNLYKQYGNFQCIKGLDLKVPHGSVYGFLGPNGAGKTTTMKMILGLVRPSSGAITPFRENDDQQKSAGNAQPHWFAD